MTNKKSGKKTALVRITLPDESELFGQIRLKGEKTQLRLVSTSPINLPSDGAALHGTADEQKISCIECFVGLTGTNYSGAGHACHQLELFPLYVTRGAEHLHPDRPVIRRVHFSVSDISSIFNDKDSFGTVHTSLDNLKELLTDAMQVPDNKLGDRALISYFLGKNEVCAIDTCIGRISATHAVSYPIGSAPFSKSVRLSIEFEESVDFPTAIRRLLSLRRFFTLVAGRPQALNALMLELKADDDAPPLPKLLELHWSLAPAGAKQARNSADEAPSARDLPLNACDRPEEFSRVLQHWMSRDKIWRLPRVRYTACVEKGRVFDVDRLVAAANMFDILPESALPAAEALSSEVIAAQAQARQIFKALPDSIERNSMLGALGRLGHPSLPKKVAARAAIVKPHLGSKLPDLDLVLKIAVQCRNHFVHGTEFDYEAAEPFSVLLTETLEFVFATSDLIEAGWHAGQWAAVPHTSGHSFTRFLAAYRVEAPLLTAAMTRA